MTAHTCRRLKEPGECYRCDLNRDELADMMGESPELDFEMFTPAGNAACKQLVTRLAADISHGVLTRNALPERIRQLCNHVANVEGHSEIYDTEPQHHIADAVNKLCVAQGWQPVSRWDW